jgi:hypothetical protein
MQWYTFTVVNAVGKTSTARVKASSYEQALKKVRKEFPGKQII